MAILKVIATCDKCENKFELEFEGNNIKTKSCDCGCNEINIEIITD